MRWVVLSAIGRDRPGLVAELAQLVYDCDANLEDSRMTILGSDFAMLLLCSSTNPESADRLGHLESIAADTQLVRGVHLLGNAIGTASRRLEITRSIVSRLASNSGNGPSSAAISAEVAYDSPVMMAVNAPQIDRPSSES